MTQIFVKRPILLARIYKQRFGVSKLNSMLKKSAAIRKICGQLNYFIIEFPTQNPVLKHACNK